MNFFGRDLLLASIIASLVVPLQMSLIPILTIYNDLGALFNIEAENGPLSNSGRMVSISIRTSKFNNNLYHIYFLLISIHSLLRLILLFFGFIVILYALYET